MTMMYLNQLTDPSGFGSGSAVPYDATSRRHVYCEIINRTAALYGSAVRMVPSNEFNGVNWCRVRFIPLADFEQLDPAEMLACIDEEMLDLPDGVDFGPADDAMTLAIEHAQELADIDEFILVRVDIEQEALDELCGIIPKTLDQTQPRHGISGKRLADRIQMGQAVRVRTKAEGGQTPMIFAIHQKRSGGLAFYFVTPERWAVDGCERPLPEAYNRRLDREAIRAWADRLIYIEDIDDPA